MILLFCSNSLQAALPTSTSHSDKLQCSVERRTEGNSAVSNHTFVSPQAPSGPDAVKENVIDYGPSDDLTPDTKIVIRQSSETGEIEVELVNSKTDTVLHEQSFEYQPTIGSMSSNRRLEKCRVGDSCPDVSFFFALDTGIKVIIQCTESYISSTTV